jgi:hypothetical protein
MNDHESAVPGTADGAGRLGATLPSHPATARSLTPEELRKVEALSRAGLVLSAEKNQLLKSGPAKGAALRDRYVVTPAPLVPPEPDPPDLRRLLARPVKVLRDPDREPKRVRDRRGRRPR